MANKKRPRTYARNRAFSRKGKERIFESDGQYILKLIVYVLLGSIWLRFNAPIEVGSIILRALPIGLIVGVFAVRKLEKYQSDRKIWYAILIIVCIIGLFSPTGIVI